jgi:hypothetical protein
LFVWDDVGASRPSSFVLSYSSVQAFPSGRAPGAPAQA